MHEMYNQTNCMYRKKLSTKVYVLYVWMTLICLLVFWPIHRKNPTNILPEFDKPHIQKHDSHPSSPRMNDYCVSSLSKSDLESTGIKKCLLLEYLQSWFSLPYNEYICRLILYCPHHATRMKVSRIWVPNKNFSGFS